MKIILHITPRIAWESSVHTGYYKPSSLESEGFIHCSTIEQTESTANLYFTNQKGLVLLCIDENRLEPKVKYEASAGGIVDEKRTESLFPHLYGPLNVSAVVRVVEFTPNADGNFVLPAEIRRLTKGLDE